MPRRLPVLGGVACGIAVAALVTLLQSSTYRADASIVLARQGRPPGSDPQLARSAEVAADLFHSRAVAESALANLRLDESPDSLLDRVGIDADPDSSLVRVRVDAPSREEARRTAQEVAEVATVLFNDRFGPQTVASIWERPRAEQDRVSPKPARNLALGALGGALLGQLLLLVARRRPRRAVVVVPPEPVRDPQPVPVPEAQPVTAPSAPEPAGPWVPPRAGSWTIGAVERLLAEQGTAFPDRTDELAVYVDSFRDVAGPDGRLPPGVELVLEDVFEDLIARARSAAASAQG